MIPGSPRSGLRAKTGWGVVGGFQPGTATADVCEDRSVRSIVDHYLGPRDAGVEVPAGHMLGNEDAMSITSETSRNKRARDRESVSDSDADAHPQKGRKVLRSHIIIESSSEKDEGPIVVSDSPDGVSTRGKKKK